MAADPLNLVGSTVANLRFDECLDAAGFGIVYRGRDKRGDHEERAAIKCYRLSRLQHTNEAMRAAIADRFEAEAKVVQRLAEGNSDIVRSFTAGELTAVGERIPYVVLEWLDGRTLTTDLEGRRSRGAKGRTLHEAIDLVDSAALALAHAHAHGVVHRDVSPANLMLAHTGGGTRLKLLDLGIAKVLSDEPMIGFAQILTTVDGAALCSPSYAAPEQFSRDVGTIGPWTDIYSLTLVLLELLRGERARPAETVAQGLVAALDPRAGAPTASSLGLTLPGPVEALLARAVALNPLERPANAGVFWSALRELAGPPPRPRVAASLMSTVLGAPLAPSIGELHAPPTVDQASGPSPFTGTLLMVDAPRGALHLLTPQAPPAAVEAGGRGGDAQAASKGLPPMTGRAMASPLAASLGPGIASPLMNAPPGSLPAASIMQAAPGAPGSAGNASAGPNPGLPIDDVAYRPTELAIGTPPTSSPRGTPLPRSPLPRPPTPMPMSIPTPTRGGNGLAIGLLLLLLVVVVASAAVIWRLVPSR